MLKPLTGEQVAALAGISASGVSKLRAAEDPLYRQAGGYNAKEVGAWLYRRALASVGKAGEGLDLSREQALLARARREALEHRAEIQRGEYTLTAKAVASSRRAGVAIRDSVLAIPARIAATLAAMSDEREVERYLTGELRAELTRLADSVAVRGNGHDEDRPADGKVNA